LNPALSDKERSYLFVEYQANYDDIVNVSQNSYFMQQQIFNVPNEENLQIQFEIGNNLNNNGSAAHIIVIEKLNKIKTFPQDLGIPSVKDLISSVSGVAIEDVLEYFDVNKTNELSTVFDIACMHLLEYRINFEELNTRFNLANQAIQVAYDNAIAAHSTIVDLDYAAELTNLAKAKILVLAKNSLIVQRHDLTKQTVLTLIDNCTKNNS
jgi:flagellin-like hook-associated protein FlgL